ncbi:MAG: YggT family protein [Roseiflexaceae bacterium]
MRARHIIAYLIGGAEALLLARLLLRLLAARPDNPFVRALLWATTPLAAPLAFLDASQPRFGAVLEFSTLALFLLLVMVGVALSMIGRRSGATRQRSTL